jgi:hypothetical protein
MTKFLFAIFLLMPVFAWAKPNPADYPITVHVTSSRLVMECHSVLGIGRTLCSQQLYLSATINGKKFGLKAAGDDYQYILRLADYNAKMIPDGPPYPDDYAPREYEYRQQYEFLFSDGKTRKFSIVSEGE